MASAALVALIAVIGAWWVSAAPFARFRGGANDPVFPRGRMSSDVLVVAIDDEALAAVGEGWPWSRATVARLVEALDPADAVVIDLLLGTPGVDDEVLAAALRRSGDVVLAAAPLDVRSTGAGRPLRTGTIVRPVPALASAAAAVGSSLALPDAGDGVLRRAPLVVETADGRIVPSLATAAFAVASGADLAPVLRRPSDVQVGSARWPTDDRYRVRISWPDGLERHISAADVLAGEIPATKLEGRVVYVGATATALGDRWSAPVGGPDGVPGVTPPAAVHHTLASREFLLPASRAETLVWLIILTAILVLAVQFLPLWGATPLVILATVGSVFAAFERSTAGVLVDLVDLAVVPVLAVPGAGALRYVTERRQRRRVTELFARFVPEPVVRELVRTGRIDDAVAGQRLDVTLLFCDLRGFTATAAQLAPAEVSLVLTEFYEDVTERVQRHGGTIVQYVGDEVFAVFGAPLPDADHASAAVDAALDIQRTVSLDVGFGTAVHSGEVVAGQVGSRRRRQYAVVGDPVNVASRLCGTAGAGEVVVSQEALGRAGRTIDDAERFVPELRGVEREVVAWRVRG